VRGYIYLVSYQVVEKLRCDSNILLGCHNILFSAKKKGVIEIPDAKRETIR
jgi:transposase